MHSNGENLNVVNCYFPTAVTKRDDSDAFEGLDVLTDEIRPFYSCLEAAAAIELVRTVWAILLRNYVRGDSVAFAVTEDTEATTQLSNGHALKESPEDHVVQILEYGFGSEFPSCRAVGNVTVKSLALHRINTLFYSEVLHGSRQQNGAQEHFDPLRLMTLGDLDLGISLAKGDNYAEIVLNHRITAVSSAFATAICHTFREVLGKVPSGQSGDLRSMYNIGCYDIELLNTWAIKPPQVRNECLHDLVQRSVSATPSAEAVCAWDGSLTYLQLDALSSALAQTLRAAGIAPRIYVPFASEKSLWSVVITLAILKAGGAFVPLDPSHPEVRLREIIRMTGARVVVTTEMYATKFSTLADHVIVASSLATLSLPIQTQLPPEATPNDPGIVLFTSGSTGTPKGMILEHKAICSHLVAHGEEMGYHGARVLQFATHTFDVAIFDIFTTLIYGGCVCIPSEEDRETDLIRAMNAMRVELALLMPQLVRIIKPEEVPTLRILATGGEPLPRDCVERWADKVRFIQVYGPAEVGICILTRLIGNMRPETVGQPLPICGCWLVDPEDPHQLVPVGAIGELVVAGPTLARAYLNNEEKTRSSFLEGLQWASLVSPHFDRFFRTGDLLQYNTDMMDGTFNFVTRKDSQIKLRGQRIEPGEVEHHLTNIPEVKVSVVVYPKEGLYAGELVAALQMTHSTTVKSGVSNGTEHRNGTEHQNGVEHRNGIEHVENICLIPRNSVAFEGITGYLAQKVPKYMIPSAFFEMKYIPFTPSGKINRRQIKESLEALTSHTSASDAAALLGIQTTVLFEEESIAHALSCKVVSLVSRNDSAKSQLLRGKNFEIWKSGMNSVLIMSLSFFIQRQYHVKVPMETLLRSTVTIQDLASTVENLVDRKSNLNEPSLDLIKRIDRAMKQLIQHLEVSHSPLRRSEPIRNIFVTGATGFLGIAIVHRLLQVGKIKIIAHVRCSNEMEGLQRITDAAKQMGWWKDIYMDRIRVWPGDLQDPNLGLSQNCLQQLLGAGSSTNGYSNGRTPHRDHYIDAIIHNGARVHYSSSYETLERVNVDSTVELLRLTGSSSSVQNFIFVSGGRHPSEISEGLSSRIAVAQTLKHAGGYAQTKFVAEQISVSSADHAFFRDRSISVVQPGYIIGDLPNGVANTRDFIWRLVAGCIEIGAYNRDEMGSWLYIADADHVAECVVSGLFEDGDVSGRVKGVQRGLLFSHLWTLLETEFGYKLQSLPHSEWISRLKEAVLRSEEAHLLFPVLHVLERDGNSLGDKDAVVTQSAEEQSRTLEIVRANVKYLIRVGFLPKRTGRRLDG